MCSAGSHRSYRPLIAFYGIGLVPDISEPAEQIVRNVASAYMILMIMLTDNGGHCLR